MASQFTIDGDMRSMEKLIPLIVIALALVHGLAAHADPGVCFEFTQPGWEDVLDANDANRLLIVLGTAADRDQPATRILVAEAGRH